MKKLELTAAAIVLSAISSAGIVTQWDFNGPSATSVPGGANNPLASIGTGTASLLGGVAGSFSSGIANGGSSDPVTTSPPNYGWQTTGYAAPGTGNGTTGVQFLVSTAGWQSVVVSFDTRHSNTSSRFIRFDYTLDGGSNWVLGTGTSIFAGTAGDTWFNNRTVDLSGVAGASNNANFGFRMVAAFDPQGTDYVASNATSSYASSGTLRWDMVTVSAEAVPEPSTIALVGLGAAALIKRRKK